MILEQDLKKLMMEHNINCFEVHSVTVELQALSVQLNDGIEELLKFAKLNNINSIFYTYFYYDKDKFLIDLDYKEMVEGLYGKTILKSIEKDIDEYNKKVESFDFSKPFALDIFVIYQSRNIYIMDVDLWASESGILDAEEKIEELLESKNELVNEKIEKDKHKTNKLMSEFKDYVFNDEEFRVCTNFNLRRQYMRTVFDKEEAKKYKKLFSRGGALNDNIDLSHFFDFIEMVWKEYKEQSKVKKQTP